MLYTHIKTTEKMPDVPTAPFMKQPTSFPKSFQNISIPLRNRTQICFKWKISTRRRVNREQVKRKIFLFLGYYCGRATRLSIDVRSRIREVFFVFSLFYVQLGDRSPAQWSVETLFTLNFAVTAGSPEQCFCFNEALHLQTMYAIL